MALSTRQIGSATASGVAAATSRIGTGGRNVASTTRPDVEKLDYSHQLGLNEESLLRFQDETGFNPDGRRQREHRDSQNALLSRGAFGFSVDSINEQNDGEQPRLFLTDVARGVGSYEENMRITSPGTVKPGSVMNYLF
ncbi:conserved hypothetical protein [Candidatus Terasakiella magnetica]|nr:conserved hypothetical protein [Candidatus Terasakiella magnetica]